MRFKRNESPDQKLTSFTYAPLVSASLIPSTSNIYGTGIAPLLSVASVDDHQTPFMADQTRSCDQLNPTYNHRRFPIPIPTISHTATIYLLLFTWRQQSTLLTNFIILSPRVCLHNCSSSLPRGWSGHLMSTLTCVSLSLRL